MRTRLSALGMVLLWPALLSAETAAAQSYPTKPFEIVCAFSPGGPQDSVGRLIAEIGGKYFGQPMVVVNKPGAGGSVAAADVISSKPEGYKAFQIAQVFFATTIRTQKVPFDSNDLVPLANFYEMTAAMAVRQDSPFKTFGDLINHARKNPGQLKWATMGRGITFHMSTMIIFKKAGVQVIDVPYKGTPETIASLLGGHIDVGVFPHASMVEQVKSGKARYLMVYYADKRYKDFPDVPTMTELGYQEAILPTYVGLYVHKNTPEDIQKKLRDVCKKIYDDPEFKKGIEKLGEEPKWGDPEFIKAGIKRQEEIGIPILKEIGLYLEK